MSKMEYMLVDCLQVPKVLFQMEKYKNLSNTAKILYSLFLDRLKFAVQNGWVDGKGDLYVIYPKSEMKSGGLLCGCESTVYREICAKCKTGKYYSDRRQCRRKSLRSTVFDGKRPRRIHAEKTDSDLSGHL